MKYTFILSLLMYIGYLGDIVNFIFKFTCVKDINISLYNCTKRKLVILCVFKNKYLKIISKMKKKCLL